MNRITGSNFAMDGRSTLSVGAERSNLAWQAFRAGCFGEALALYFNSDDNVFTGFDEKTSQWSDLIARVQPQLLEDERFRRRRDSQSLFAFLCGLARGHGDSGLCDLVSVADRALIDEFIQTRTEIVCGLDRFKLVLSRLRTARLPPRRGLNRLVYLYFLRGGFWREDGSSVGKLTQLQFDLMTGRGQAYIRRTHFLAWSYDDAHVRRYMTQFGFADRARDESWYRSAERYQDAVCFTNDVSEYVKTEWVNARQERLRLLY